jgi:hypothetical protein
MSYDLTPKILEKHKSLGKNQFQWVYPKLRGYV